MNKEMTLNEYEEFVLGLMSPYSMKDQESKLATAGLGLSGEGGEFADNCKKILFHGKEMTEEVRQDMIKELGDSFFYLAFAAREVCGVSLQEVLNTNVEKLSDRYKEKKFSVEEFKAKEKAKRSFSNDDDYSPWWKLPKFFGFK
ncbi:MAG: nucleotide pyrophosphohydrolase [Crenarchaeota archaeon]|nr:MAG: nucleotide pyrophosphohydrolase [Thermoproteota archaeon]